MIKFNLKLLMVAAGLLLSSFSGVSQEQIRAAAIGDKIPDIVFKDVINYKGSRISLEELRGKIIILDFWATWCAPCVAEMPKFSDLQNKFKTDLIILPISFENKKVVSQFKEKRSDLQLPFIIEPPGSLIRKIFPHRGIPHSVVVDKKGLVMAITESSNITAEVIEKLVRNETITLHHKKDLMDFNMNLPLFQNENGGTGENALIRSTIAPYIEGVSSSGGIYDKFDGLFQINVPITQLFEYAFDFPMKYRNRMLLEGSNDTDRYPINDADYKKLQVNDMNFKRNNLFCYSLSAPYLANKDVKVALHALRAIMKDDLNRTFKSLLGLSVSVEKRNFECYIIKRNKKFNLKQISEVNHRNASQSDYTSTTIEGLEGLLLEYLTDKPIVDQTSVAGLDILFKRSFNAYKNNLELLNKDLSEYGLEIVEGKQMIDMLVFKVNK